MSPSIYLSHLSRDYVVFEKSCIFTSTTPIPPLHVTCRSLDQMSIDQRYIFQLPQDQRIQLEIPNIEKLTNQKPFLIIWKYWYLIYINMHPLKTSQVNSLPYYVFARLSLRKKCPNTELFLVRIFLYSVPIQKNTDQK